LPLKEVHIFHGETIVRERCNIIPHRAHADIGVQMAIEQHGSGLARARGRLTPPARQHSLAPDGMLAHHGEVEPFARSEERDTLFVGDKLSKKSEILPRRCNSST
jgi:hypothetical protein